MNYTLCPKRSVYKRATNNSDLKLVSEEGFLFLTSRSDFWRNQKPIYVTNDEKDNNVTSSHLKLRKTMSAKPRGCTPVEMTSRSKSAPAKQRLRIKSAKTKKH